MCGIAGFLDFSAGKGRAGLAAAATRMAATLRHRGPDDSGAWADETSGIALAHTRLSILDLSPEGRQPMHSACGRYVIVFNGEIYNFRPLRSQLETLGHRFRGSSDTEVMLAAIRQWGLDAALPRFNGMFAFALWDHRLRILSLGRDRIGEKPLYYGRMDNVFLFGSELKSLQAHPRFDVEIDREALQLFLRFGYIPAPHSIFCGVHKLPPGTLLRFSPSSPRTAPTLTSYWSARQVAERAADEPFTASPREAVAHLHSLLDDAVRLRMTADVPVGAFLSGGIDSSMIVALMQAASPQPIRTFTIGFREADFDESACARRIAHRLGTDHTELRLDASDALSLIPRLPQLYDEPFADPSQLPTLLLSQLTRASVTVALSGDGGDEIFGGYRRYFWVRNLWKVFGRVPPFLRSRIAGALTALSPAQWQALFRAMSPAIPALRQRTASRDAYRIAALLEMASPETMYAALMTIWKDAGHPVSSSPNPFPHSIERMMMYSDAVGYLPDDILVKVDRATMSVGLEGRIPFLDDRVVEFGWRLPLSMKMRRGQGKWILRQLMLKYLPKELFNRPKKGFGVPVDQWLRGPLRNWAENLLDAGSLHRQGYLDPAPIRKKWSEHLAGSGDWAPHLWTVLMFQAWLENQAQRFQNSPRLASSAVVN
jgi:asparagine synthase (glutamine-hydrolysing)